MYLSAAGRERRRIMATSSIGQPVILDEERAKRLMEILSKPYVPAKSKSGRKLELSTRKLDPKRFK